MWQLSSNGQAAYGADVISRVEYASNGITHLEAAAAGSDGHSQWGYLRPP